MTNQTLPMHNSFKRILFLFRTNLANMVTLAGVLPLSLLLTPVGLAYLPYFLVYNNAIDDLDGVLARKLGIESSFGAVLDNLCDTVAHVLLVMVISAVKRGTIMWWALLPVTAILIRMALRIDAKSAQAFGSSTNELLRHLLFLLLLEQTWSLDIEVAFIAVFLCHSVSLLVPFQMTYLVRGWFKSPFYLLFLNIMLLVTVFVPLLVTLIAPVYFIAYLFSLGWGAIKWVRSTDLK
jgi:phosphatidylglycerophosphate synthase